MSVRILLEFVGVFGQAAWAAQAPGSKDNVASAGDAKIQQTQAISTSTDAQTVLLHRACVD